MADGGELERARFAVHPPEKRAGSDRVGRRGVCIRCHGVAATATHESALRRRDCESTRRKRELAIVIKPTLRQAWPREDPRPQDAFKISMFSESCNSH